MRSIGLGVGLSVIASAAQVMIGAILPSKRVRLGINMQGPNDFTPTLIYTNAMKSSRNIFDFGRSTGATRPTVYVDVVNGRPQADVRIPVMNPSGTYATGLYNIRFKGQATVGKANSVTGPSAFTYNATDGYSYGTWDLTTGAMIISFSSMSADFDIRTLEIIRPGYTFGGQKYTTEWLKLMSRVSTVRLMDWIGVNGSGVVTNLGFDLKPNEVTWGDALEMCNELGKDAWVCVPPMMSDSAITSFVTDIKAKLNNKVLLELGNELWNTQSGYSLPHTYIATTYLANIYQNIAPLNWANLPGNAYETRPSTSDTAQAGDWSIRRVANEVYIKHGGVPAFRTGQRFYVTNIGGGAAAALMPAVGSYVTITVLSDNEFKFANAGADAAEAVLSRAQRPQADHAPYLAISKTAGVVRIVHDGSLTISGQVGLCGAGTYSSIAEAETSGYFKRYTPNVIDANTFEVTLATAGTDIATVTNPASSQTNYLTTITDVNAEIVQNLFPSQSRVFDLQYKWIVLRTKRIKQIAQAVYGADYASKVTTVLASQRNALATGASMYVASEWLAFKDGSPRSWAGICDMLATADYPQWVSGDYTAIRADATGTAAAQLLLDKLPSREDALQALAATAKIYGVRTGMYEAGWDTTQPASVSETTGVPVRFRELAHHSPLMRAGTKLMLDTFDKYGVELACWYGATVSLPKTGDGSSSTGESFFVAELMGSITDAPSNSASAPKLAGIDDYLTAALVPAQGSFYRGGPTLSVAAHVGTETRPGVFGPLVAANAGVNFANNMGSRGGWTIYPTRGSGTNYPWPIARYVMYAPAAGIHNLILVCKTENVQPAVKVRLLFDGVEVGSPLTAAQLNPVSTAVYTSNSGLADSGAITFNVPTPGIYEIDLVFEQFSDTSSTQFIFSGLKLVF